jgi:hypothetical protein
VFLIDQRTTRLSSARRSSSEELHLVLLARMRMAMGRQLLFPKSEQWVIVQYVKR